MPSSSADDPMDANDFIKTVRAIWAECLEQPEADIDETVDFFASGGSSIQAMIMISRLGEALGLDIPPEAIVDHRTIAALADFIAGLGPSVGAQEGWI